MADLPTQHVAFIRRRLARVSGWLAFAAAVLPLGVYGVLSLAGAGGELLGMLNRAVLASLPLAAFSFLAGRDLVGESSLRREGDDLVIGRPGSERRFPLATVREGIVVPSRAGTSVELHLDGGDHLVARVDSIADAQTILRALRVDVGNQRCRVQLADRTAALVVAMGAPLGLAFFCAVYLRMLIFPLFEHVPGNMMVILLIGLYAILAALLRSLIALPDVTVGTDGLAFGRGWRETFVPFADLAAVRMGGLGVRFVRRDGSEQMLRALAGVSPVRFAALELRIHEAMASRGEAPRQTLEQLDRGDRTVAEWRAGLAALARRGVDYRGAGLSVEDLEALLASPEATAERRLAAAVALSAGNHPAAPERIRIAAAQCASERLRVALEKLSEGDDDDDAIAEALGEEEARRRA